MKRLMAGTGFVVLLLSTESYAQSGAVTSPQADAAHASQPSCVILKRMGRFGRTESRLYHFGLSGKQFRYVEGKLPEGFSNHGKMTDHDVRKLQSRGAQVLVLDSHYTSEDLQEARADCQRGTGKAPNMVEAKASPTPALTSVASTTAPRPNGPTPPTANATPLDKAPSAKAPTPKAHDSASPVGTDAALLDVSSTPT